MALEADYLRLRARLPTDKGEVKGRQLAEIHIAAVLELLRQHEVLFEATAIDPGIHTVSMLEQHRQIQAEKITSGLTDEHHPNVHKGAHELRRQLEAMSLPLYMQTQAMFELVIRAMNHGQLFWVQRRPSELANFHWIIDAKHDALPLTPWEEWWSFCVMPILQSRSIRKPIECLQGADYSHFERFLMEWQPWAFPGTEPPKDNKVVNLRLLLTESFKFSATPEPGLELVDVATTAVRRALRGSLRIEGWVGLTRIMIHRPQHYIDLISLGDNSHVQTQQLRYRRVLQTISRGGRSMIIRGAA